MYLCFQTSLCKTSLTEKIWVHQVGMLHGFKTYLIKIHIYIRWEHKTAVHLLQTVAKIHWICYIIWEKNCLPELNKQSQEEEGNKPQNSSIYESRVSPWGRCSSTSSPSCSCSGYQECAKTNTSSVRLVPVSTKDSAVDSAGLRSSCSTVCADTQWLNTFLF